MKRIIKLILLLTILIGSTGFTFPNHSLAETNKVPIAGSSILTAKQLGDYVLLHNPEPKLIGIDIYRLADLFLSIGRMENIRGDIAFAQSIHETGFFNYGNDVLPEQNNYSGIGAVGGGAQGAYFKTPEEGVRAQIQHLKAYANTDPLVTELIDPRFNYVKRGTAPYWTDLNGKWAVPGNYYGELILGIYEKMKLIQLSIPNVDSTITHDLPMASLYLKYDRPLMAPDGKVAKVLKKGYTYRIYGTLGNNYNLGGSYVVVADSSKMNLYIGRLYIPDNNSVLSKPDGKKHRNLKVGETIKVYSFDDQAYYVGGGYYINKNQKLSFYKGMVTINDDTPLYNSNGEVVRTLTKNQQFRVYNIKGKKLEVGGGLYILSDKNKNSYLNL
ncbi:glucosaminidase domain-containing protein [Cytobacillus sp. FJAT-54145]|uniref:Glucosaminidase domain-containing protein n=1 Tax=Cytobacillus spartinae TaxID=3299023 RepID=A0ABW6KC31_9BACI